MKKLSYLLCGFVALSMAFVACEEKEKRPIVVNKDLVYVVGDATTVSADAENKDKAEMAVGKNEAAEGASRVGMYEKYVALKGGKDFQIMMLSKAGTTKFYGATLQKDSIDGSNDQIKEEVYRGTISENAKMQVEKDGFYHVIYDRDLNTILVNNVKWGVRGVNGDWGWKEMNVSDFNQETMTWSIAYENVKSGEFKYAYSNGWKIELDSTVKANTNLGEGLVPGAGNIKIKSQENATITLTWTLAGGEIASNYKHEVKGTVVTVDPRNKAAGFSGDAFSTTDAGNWADPKEGSTLAVFDAEASEFDAESMVGTFVWKAENLTFDGGKNFKFRFDGGWLGFSAIALEGDAENFEQAATDDNITVKETKKYNVTVSIAWDGGGAASYTLNFAEVAE